MADVSVRSELNASIWKIEAAVGDSVEAGQTVVLLECMKTEIPVSAPRAGRVKSILVKEGEVVSERQVLLVLEA